jgi:probable RNA-binding protein EIF1AD
MPRPKRNLLATIDSTVTPPDFLPAGHFIARITTAAGNNLYNAELPDGSPVLAELEAKFRSTVWIKRGSYVVIDTSALSDRDNKLDGEIVNVVRDEKAWRKMAYWYVLYLLYMLGYPGAWVGYHNMLYGKLLLIWCFDRPKEFVKKSTYIEDSDEEESTVGKMPPADSDED